MSILIDCYRQATLLPGVGLGRAQRPRRSLVDYSRSVNKLTGPD